jgi:hypothetical protein
MISNLVIIIIIICFFEFYSVLTIDNDLIRIEENILYSYLKTQSNFTLFYDKILQSNDIDDIKRIHRIITQDDIQKFTDDVVEFNLEHKVKKNNIND